LRRSRARVSRTGRACEPMIRGSFRCISLSTYDRPAPHPLLDLFHSLSPAYPASYPPYSGRLANRQSANSPRIPQPLPLSQTADQETIHPIIPSPARRRAVKPVKTRIERQRVAIFVDSGSLGRCGFSRFVDDRGCRALSRRLARKRVLISACTVWTHVIYLVLVTTLRCTPSCIVYDPRPRLVPHNHDRRRSGCCPTRASQVCKSVISTVPIRVLAIPSVCQDCLGTRTPK
jgi:hypothetical protein